LGCYGNLVSQTPNIDRLAKDGVAFDNAFTSCVVCMSARASILTGRMPRTHGFVLNDATTTPGDLQKFVRTSGHG